MIRRLFRYAGIVILAVSAWIAWDLMNPRTHDLREFDGHEVARLDTAMWRSYYDHRPVALFGQLSELLRKQYGFPFWRSLEGAFYAARAAEVFQAGHQRADYRRALPDLANYYALIQKTTTPSFDVNKAASLELEWGIIHRERARHDKKDLDQSLADLQAAIYGRPARDFEEHARYRADAMLLRDERSENGTPSSDDWNRIGTLLDGSWVSMQKIVSGTRD